MRDDIRRLWAALREPTPDPACPATGSDVENRVLARVLALSCLLGGPFGALNLLASTGIPDGPGYRLFYTGMMLVVFALGLALWRRPDLLADCAPCVVVVMVGTWVLITQAVGDAQRYAGPEFLIGVTILAAWVLSTRMLAGYLVVVAIAVAVVIAPYESGPRTIALQTVIETGLLALPALVVHGLRRRTRTLLSRLHTDSTTDPLTGLHNRRHLDEVAPSFWAGTRRRGELAAALVLDLDHFKAINDTHGHVVGDRTLEAVADAIRGAVRRHELVARLGGEEIGVLTSVTHPREAVVLGERLRARIAASGSPVPVTVSIGVATAVPDVEADPRDGVWRLMEQADVAVYEAKEAGRDRVVLAGDGLAGGQHLPRPAAH